MTQDVWDEGGLGPFRGPVASSEPTATIPRGRSTFKSSRAGLRSSSPNVRPRWMRADSGTFVRRHSSTAERRGDWARTGLLAPFETVGDGFGSRSVIHSQSWPERGDHRGRVAMPKPIVKPAGAEEVLAAVAARYAPGSTVSLPQIGEAGGVSPGLAGKIRRWARADGRWPYVDGRGRGPARSSGEGKAACRVAIGRRLLASVSLRSRGPDAGSPRRRGPWLRRKRIDRRRIAGHRPS